VGNCEGGPHALQAIRKIGAMHARPQRPAKLVRNEELDLRRFTAIGIPVLHQNSDLCEFLGPTYRYLVLVDRCE